MFPTVPFGSEPESKGFVQLRPRAARARTRARPRTGTPARTAPCGAQTVLFKKILSEISIYFGSTILGRLETHRSGSRFLHVFALRSAGI